MCPDKSKRKETLMEKRIFNLLNRAPKRGIWMKELAEKLGISRPLLNYYLFGMKKNGSLAGGKLRKCILIRKEGNNHFVKLNIS